MLRGRAGPNVRSATATVVRAAGIGTALAVVAVGCRSHEPSTTRLVDGSAPPALPGGLGDVGPGAVATRVRVLRVAELGVRGRACLRPFRPEFSIPSTTIVVERAGAIGASLTFRDGRRRFVLGCDRTDEPAGDGGKWCARSVGRLIGGRLRDPRVDILCRSAGGDRIGFGWVEPAPETHWIIARSGLRTEVYEVAAGLPVRLATTDVDVATSSATFDVTEYDVNGNAVRDQRLEASVAG